MWTSPTTNLRLAADRQGDFHRVATEQRRSRRPDDGSGSGLAEAIKHPVRRPVIGRLVALVTRA